jgi:hypothetical protein
MRLAAARPLLAADDVAINRDLLGEMLGRHGPELTFAGNGEAREVRPEPAPGADEAPPLDRAMMDRLATSLPAGAITGRIGAVARDSGEAWGWWIGAVDIMYLVGFGVLVGLALSEL